MEPDFLLTMVLHGFLHGVGFLLALLLFGHPWIIVIIVLAVLARRRARYDGALALADRCWRGSRRRSIPLQRRAEMSFKPEVQADDTGAWYDNALRFASRAEAEAQVADLMMRWTAVRGIRVIESTDPVNYRYVDGRLERVALVEAIPATPV
jgi:hypothetical protein